MINRTINYSTQSLRYMNWIPVLLLLQACNSQSHESPNQSPTISAVGDTVTVSENTSLLSKLKFVTTTNAQHALKLNAAATVKIIPSSYVEIPVPFAGRIVKSHVKLGQKLLSIRLYFQLVHPTILRHKGLTLTPNKHLCLPRIC